VDAKDARLKVAFEALRDSQEFIKRTKLDYESFLVLLGSKARNWFFELDDPCPCGELKTNVSIFDIYNLLGDLYNRIHETFLECEKDYAASCLISAKRGSRRMHGESVRRLLPVVRAVIPPVHKALVADEEDLQFCMPPFRETVIVDPNDVVVEEPLEIERPSLKEAKQTNNEDIQS
jgi:hypothetical protein